MRYYNQKLGEKTFKKVENLSGVVFSNPERPKIDESVKNDPAVRTENGVIPLRPYDECLWEVLPRALFRPATPFLSSLFFLPEKISP